MRRTSGGKPSVFLALALASVLITGCTPTALKEQPVPQAPGVSSSQPTADSITAVPTAKIDEVIAPQPPPPDSTVFRGANFTVAVPKNAKHEKDIDIDSFTSNDGSEETLVITTLHAKTMAEAAKEFNSEDPTTAVEMHGVLWEGTKSAAIGERSYTGGQLAGVRTGLLFAQLPKGRIVAVQATAPGDRYDDSLVAACLETFTVLSEEK